MIECYVNWCRCFILFHNKRHPQEMAEAQVNRYLAHLASSGIVTAGEQTEAWQALSILYRDVLYANAQYQTFRPSSRRCLNRTPSSALARSLSSSEPSSRNHRDKEVEARTRHELLWLRSLAEEARAADAR